MILREKEHVYTVWGTRLAGMLLRNSTTSYEVVMRQGGGVVLHWQVGSTEQVNICQQSV